MLPLRVRVDLGAMAVKGYTAFPETPELLVSSSDFSVSYPGHALGASYPTAEMKSVYSTASADWAINI